MSRGCILTLRKRPDADFRFRRGLKDRLYGRPQHRRRVPFGQLGHCETCAAGGYHRDGRAAAGVAQEATRRIPIVMGTSGIDPVALGLVPSRAGPATTGFAPARKRVTRCQVAPEQARGSLAAGRGREPRRPGHPAGPQPVAGAVPTAPPPSSWRGWCSRSSGQAGPSPHRALSTLSPRRTASTSEGDRSSNSACSSWARLDTNSAPMAPSNDRTGVFLLAETIVAPSSGPNSEIQSGPR